ALYDADAPDAYIGQVVLGIDGRGIDTRALESATQALMSRHANLRACFRYSGGRQPVQVIPREVRTPWAELDWSSLPSAEQSDRLACWLAGGRRQRFDMTRSPLLRAVLVQLGPERHQLVLTWHHILLDGWSLSLLVRDLVALYERKGDPSGLPRVTPYREYLSWIAQQDRAA